MTLRLAAEPAQIEAAALMRRSVRVGTAADYLDCDQTQIRKLVQSGELASHRLGKRGIRIYVDSIEAYRDARSAGRPVQPAPPKRQRLSSQHYEAVAYLRSRRRS